MPALPLALVALALTPPAAPSPAVQAAPPLAAPVAHADPPLAALTNLATQAALATHAAPPFAPHAAHADPPLAAPTNLATQASTLAAHAAPPFAPHAAHANAPLAADSPLADPPPDARGSDPSPTPKTPSAGLSEPVPPAARPVDHSASSNLQPTRPLALAPPRPKPEPAPPLLQPPPVDPRAAAARAAYAAGDYIGAARQYEALARDTAAPRYLFNAGMAREAAGELSHATIQWRRYLSSGTATPEDRQILDSKLAAASSALITRQLQPESGVTVVILRRGDHDPIELTPSELTAPITLELGDWTARIHGPGDPVELTVTITPTDSLPIVLPAPHPRTTPTPPPVVPTTGRLTAQVGPPRALRRGVEISLNNDQETRHETLRYATATWDLPRGNWTIYATAPDRTDIQRTITVGDLPQRIDLSLRLTPAARGYRIITPAILGALGVGLTAGGAALAARSSTRGHACRDATTCEAAANTVLDASNGVSLLGTGLGALIPAATAAAGARPRALAIEAGLGGAIFVGGLTWYLAEAIGTSALDHRPREHAAAATLGVGAGMVGSAVLLLLVRRALRDRRAATHTNAKSHHVSF